MLLENNEAVHTSSQKKKKKKKKTQTELTKLKRNKVLNT